MAFEDGSGLRSWIHTIGGAAAAISPPSGQQPIVQSVSFRVPSANTADIKIGTSTSQVFTVVKGTSFTPQLLQQNEERRGYDLRKIYISGTSADTVEIIVDA